MEKIIRTYTSLIVCMLAMYGAFGQNIPKSFRFKEVSDTIPQMPSIGEPYYIPKQNNDQLIEYEASLTKDCEDCGGSYYGYGIQGQIDIKAQAQYVNDDIDEGRLYIFKLASETALGLQFYFDRFIIPEGASLFIYNEDKSRILGPYTTKNTPEKQDIAIHFGSPPLSGNTVYFEYFEKNGSNTGDIRIVNTIHIYKLFGGAHPSIDVPTGSCEVDVSCPAGQGWVKEANSVAGIWYFDPNYNLAGRCTGTLLNNTKEDGTPYFLTAGHCYNTFDPNNNQYNYSTWQFVFKYHSQHCGEKDVSDFFVVYGSSLLAQDAQVQSSSGLSASSLTSDYLLLQLNTTPQELFTSGACYSGWSLNLPTVYPSPGYAVIHHPLGNLKKITWGSNSVVNSFSTPYIPGLNPAHFYEWTFTPNQGIIEPGSSGAPLYNGYHQVIGTVKGPKGKLLKCSDNPATGFFGKFSWHWSQGSFKQWLDPTNLTANSTFGIMSFCPPNNETLDHPTPGIVIPSSQNINGGFKLNGKVAQPSVIICPSQLLSIKPKADYFGVHAEYEDVDCDIDDAQGCDNLSGVCRCGTGIFGWTWNCECSYFYYQMFLAELDYNLNPNGASGSHIYKHLGFGYLSAVSFDPADVGMTVVPGRYYNVGIGHTYSSGNWQYSNSNFYMMPASLNLNNQTVSASLYADNDVTLQNVTVQNNQQLKVGAKTSINVKNNSSLKVGRYYINPSLTCTSALYRPGQDVGDNVNYMPPGYNYTNELPAAPSIPIQPGDLPYRLYPNPAQTNVFIIMEDKELLNKPVLIIIYDSFGKEVYNSEVLNTTNQLDMDIKNLKQGLYILKLSTAKKDQVFKFIKN